MKTIIRDAAPDGDGQLWELKPRVITSGPSILVVGPDRVGKTTLVQHMSQMTNIPAFKCPSEKQIFKQGGRSSLAFDYTLTHFIHQTGYRFISDRAYPCEWVYSRVFGRETDQELLEKIDEQHTNLGTKILFAYSSEEPREEDDLVPSEKYWDVVLGYRQFMDWTNCDVAIVDTARMLRSYQDGGDISKYVAEEVLEMLGFE